MGPSVGLGAGIYVISCVSISQFLILPYAWPTIVLNLDLHLYAAGSSSHSLVADPRFKGAKDYRLQDGSPAVDAGVRIPEDWPDPLRRRDKGKPDLGALPLGVEPFAVGRAK